METYEVNIRLLIWLPIVRSYPSLDESQRREIRDKIFQIDLEELGSHHGAGDAAAWR
jgi:hypothetical protein